MSTTVRALGRGAAAICLLLVATTRADAQAGDWPSWGGDLDNNNKVVSEHKIGRDNVHELQVKWKYDLGSTTDMSAKPTLRGQTLYFPDFAGYLHAVDAETGQQVWKKSFREDYSGPAGQYIPLSRNSPAIFGDLLILGSQTDLSFDYQGAMVIAVSRHTGNLEWAVSVDEHPASIVTQSPVVYGNRVYVGVASLEEALPNFIPGYPCCTFRGSVVMLDAVTGALLHKTYTTPGGDEPLAERDPGAYSGNAVWGGQPAVSRDKGWVYVATGNNYDVPEEVKACEAEKLAGTRPTDDDCDLEFGLPGNHYNTIMALDARTLDVVWARRLGGFDAWNGACGIPGLPLPDESKPECPNPAGPDYDFGEGPMLIPATIHGRPGELVVAGQKSGIYWALDAATGEVIWDRDTGAGGLAGGMIFGSATDGDVIYAPNANVSQTLFTLTNPAPGSAPQTATGFWTALDAKNGGEILWQAADPLPASFNNSPATVANGVVYVSSAGLAPFHLDGAFRALDAETGEILWSFPLGGDEDQPVMAASAPTLSNGVLYWGAGYGRGNYGPDSGSTRWFYAFELPQKGKNK